MTGHVDMKMLWVAALGFALAGCQYQKAAGIIEVPAELRTSKDRVAWGNWVIVTNQRIRSEAIRANNGSVFDLRAEEFYHRRSLLARQVSDGRLSSDDFDAAQRRELAKLQHPPS